jgi:prephenate dehydrogenase
MKLKRITVVGCGLIGASFALALRRRCDASVRIAGWDSSAFVLDQALQTGIIDEIDGALPGGRVSASDLIYLAMPVGGIISFLQERGAQVARGALVTDAGSTKELVCAAALDYLPEGRCFVGGHPVAGSHLHGPTHARADLFDNAPYVLISDRKQKDDEALATISELVEMIGARAILKTAEEHDRAMALVSHLPQLLSSALAATVNGQASADCLSRLSGTGYRDMTRLAESSWSIWGDIFATNPLPIADALDQLLDKLLAARDELRRNADWTSTRLVKTRALFDGPL